MPINKHVYLWSQKGTCFAGAFLNDMLLRNMIYSLNANMIDKAVKHRLI